MTVVVASMRDGDATVSVVMGGVGREDAAHTGVGCRSSNRRACIARRSTAFIRPSYSVSASYISFIHSFIRCIRAYEGVSG